jgi:hypothetical protein
MRVNLGDLLRGLFPRHRRSGGAVGGTLRSLRTRSRDAVESSHVGESFGRTRRVVRAVAAHSHLRTSGGRPPVEVIFFSRDPLRTIMRAFVYEIDGSCRGDRVHGLPAMSRIVVSHGHLYVDICILQVAQDLALRNTSEV